MGAKAEFKITNQTELRNRDERDSSVPFWSSFRWLQSQAERIVSRLKERCAIHLTGQPRAALICQPVTGSTFTATLVSPDPSSVLLRLQPLRLKTPFDLKFGEVRESNNDGRSSHDHQSGNRPCIRFDANTTVKLGSELSLELLDLTIDGSAADFQRKPIDLFPPGTMVGIFEKGANLARFAEVIDIESSGLLSVQLKPETPRMIDPDFLLDSAMKADDKAYLTFKDLSRALHLTVHVITRLVDDVMALAPEPEAKTRSRGRFNIGLGLRVINKFCGVVGWTRFSQAIDNWIFSKRTLAALHTYAEMFPEVIDFIAGWDCNSAVDICNIFPEDTYKRFRDLKNFLRNKVRGNRTMTKADAPFLDTEGIRVLESSAFPLPIFSESVKEEQVVSVSPTNVLALLPEGGRLMPNAYMKWIRSLQREMGKFHILDRVIYVGRSTSMFGLPGIIIGCYPVLGEERLEVLFDTTFAGAISIRDSPERCGIITGNNLLHFPLFAKSTGSLSTQPTTNRQQPGSVKPPSPRHIQHDLDSCLPPEWVEAYTKTLANAPSASARQMQQESEPFLPPEWIKAPPAAFANPPPASTSTPSFSTKTSPSLPWPGMMSKSPRKLKSPQSASPQCNLTSPFVSQPQQEQQASLQPMENSWFYANRPKSPGQQSLQPATANFIPNLMNLQFESYNNNNLTAGCELLQQRYPPNPQYQPHAPPCLPPCSWQNECNIERSVPFENMISQPSYALQPMMMVNEAYPYPVATDPAVIQASYNYNQPAYFVPDCCSPILLQQMQTQDQQVVPPILYNGPSLPCQFPPSYVMDVSIIPHQWLGDMYCSQKGINFGVQQNPPP